MARVHIRSLGSQSTRLLVLLALAASVLTIGLLSVSAQGDEQTAMTALEHAEPASTTTLVVDGAGSRSVSHDGVVGRFSISVLRPSILEAVSAGNTAINAIRDSVQENCTPGEENADHTAAPTCISPNGLQTTSVNISEDFDWTEQGRVPKGFRYEYRFSIALRGYWVRWESRRFGDQSRRRPRAPRWAEFHCLTSRRDSETRHARRNRRRPRNR